MTISPPAAQANPIATYARFEDHHWWYVGRRQIVRALVERVTPPSKDCLIIDVGCGPGGNLASFAKDYSCAGIDTSPLAIELASQRYPSMSFSCGYAPKDLGEKAGRADVTLLMDVLEHVPDDAGMLESLVATGKPGSHLLITVPSGPDLWSPHDEAAGHLRRYTKDTFEGLWSGLPLSPLLVSPFNSRVYPLVKLVRSATSALKLRHRGNDSEGTDLRMPPRPLNRALTNIFAEEARRLVAALGTSAAPFRRGVSLVAVLRRT